MWHSQSSSFRSIKATQKCSWVGWSFGPWVPISCFPWSLQFLPFEIANLESWVNRQILAYFAPSPPRPVAMVSSPQRTKVQKNDSHVVLWLLILLCVKYPLKFNVWGRKLPTTTPPTTTWNFTQNLWNVRKMEEDASMFLHVGNSSWNFGCQVSLCCWSWDAKNIQKQRKTERKPQSAAIALCWRAARWQWKNTIRKSLVADQMLHSERDQRD